MTEIRVLYLKEFPYMYISGLAHIFQHDVFFLKSIYIIKKNHFYFYFLGNIKLPFILSFDGMTYSRYMEKKFSQTFKVPNHIKTTMKRKRLHSRSNPVTGDHTKRIFKKIDYFESQISKKYMNLLSFMNKYITYPVTELELRKTEYNHKTLNYLKDKFKPSDRDKVYGFIQNTQTKQDLHNKKILTRDFLEKNLLNSQNIRDSTNALETNTKPLKRRRRGIPSSKDESSFRLKVRFSLGKPITTEQEANEKFRKHLKYQLAKRMRVPLPCIQSMTIKSGEFTFKVVYAVV